MTGGAGRCVLPPTSCPSGAQEPSTLPWELPSQQEIQCRAKSALCQPLPSPNSPEL